MEGFFQRYSRHLKRALKKSYLKIAGMPRVETYIARVKSPLFYILALRLASSLFEQVYGLTQ